MAGIKVLGISTSPRANGNTSILVKSALDGGKAAGEVEAQYLSLHDKTITPCDGCDTCFEKGLCVFEGKDDFENIHEKMEASDAIIIGSPVYYGTVCAQCKALMDRSYKHDAISAAQKVKNVLRLKVGAAITVGGGRHGGQEATLQAIHTYYHFREIIPISMVSPTTMLGAAGIATAEGKVAQEEWDLWAIKRRTSTLEVAWMLGRKLAVIAKILKAGIKASGLDVPDTPYGSDMPEVPYHKMGH